MDSRWKDYKNKKAVKNIFITTNFKRILGWCVTLSFWGCDEGALENKGRGEV